MCETLRFRILSVVVLLSMLFVFSCICCIGFCLHCVLFFPPNFLSFLRVESLLVGPRGCAMLPCWLSALYHGERVSVCMMLDRGALESLVTREDAGLPLDGGGLRGCCIVTHRLSLYRSGKITINQFMVIDASCVVSADWPVLPWNTVSIFVFSHPCPVSPTLSSPVYYAFIAHPSRTSVAPPASFGSALNSLATQ